MPTLLDVVRGDVTMDQLPADAALCHPLDRLTPEEAAEICGCQPKTVYDWLAKGKLQGPPGVPNKRVWGWSVLKVMGPTAPPAPVKAVAPRGRRPRRAAPCPQGLRFLREGLVGAA